MLTSTLLATAALLSLSTASPAPLRRQASSFPNVTDAKWDGKCFYPEPDDDFELDTYLGRWYQVAGTVAPFTSGCTCVYAQYSLNTNGTVNVFNGCQLGNQNVTIQGTATPVPESAGYGEGGVLRVQFPGQPAPECPGPNYIVQDIRQDEDDEDSFAIVQASNFSTLFLLSRRQNPPEAQIERWLQRAGRMGTDLSKVVRTNQTGCLFT